MVESGGVQPDAHLFKDLFDPRPHDAYDLCATGCAAIVLKIASFTPDFDHFAVINARRMDTTIERLDPFRRRRWHLKPHGDIGGDVIAANPHRVGVDHVLLDENRQTGRAASEINASGTKFLFVFHQRRSPADVGRRGYACQFQITAFDAMRQMLDGRAVHGQHVHINRQMIAKLSARIDQA